MSISRVQIEHYRSIKKCSLTLNDINILIGENGSGKTNVISAIKYFYDNLLSSYNDESIYNCNNKYSNCVKISITYDLHELQIRCKQQISLNKSSYLPYFEKILEMGNNGLVTLTMVKIKDRKIIWQGANANERALIYGLIPFYFIDSRSLNLTDWSNLWKLIGDLVKTDNKTSQSIRGNVTDIIEHEDYRLRFYYEKLANAFENANVKLEKFTPQKSASILAQLYFEGSEFDFKENKLFHFSNGTNSFNYTKLLIEILLLISQKKMKSPFIIIDEPEVSLHHQLIDELSARIFNTSNNLQYLISTHSPRLVKYIMANDSGKSKVFHVRIIDQISTIYNMKLFDDNKESKPKIRITDDHANAYFSKLLFSIEGETELELFENKYLKELFPVLKQTDIINKAMSDEIVKKIISPKIRNYSTPMIGLVDMDKVIRRDKGAHVPLNSFRLIEDFFKNYNISNERYYYTEKRKKTYQVRKRIFAIVQKCRFHYALPLFSTEDYNFDCLLTLIKQYFHEYGLVVNRTTAEGMLINKENQYLFWEFAKSYIFSASQKAQVESYYNSLSNDNDKLNYLRLLFKGKSDFILNLDEISELNPDPAKANGIYDIIRANRKDKTSGWVSKWIEYFLCLILNVDYNDKAKFKKVKKAIEDSSDIDSIKKEFANYFSEIREAILLLEKAIKNHYS